MAEAINRRIEMTEAMRREVYGLGVMSHAFIEDRMMPAWYESYRSLDPTPRGLLVPGARLSTRA